jgi:predicted MFS family arabinose efflux permease
MMRALRHRVYRRLFLAQIVALLGTGLATVALGLLAYDIAGADAGQILGTALAIKMIAYVVVAPVASAVVARLPRKSVLVGADVVRMVVAACLPLVDQVWQIYVLILVLQAASATFTPTFQSVIPDVLPDEEDYTAALSLSRLAYDLESVISPALAAALLWVVSSSTLFFGTAAGFAGSALLVVSVLIPHHDGEVRQRAEAPFGVRVRAGMALFVQRPALRPILALNLTVASAGAFVIVQTVVVVRSVFALPEQSVAWVLGASGLGSMTAALLLPRVLRTVSERVVMLTGAATLTGATALIPLALAAGGPTAGILAIVALWLFIGVGWSSVETPVGRIIRRTVDRADLPAAFAAQFSLQHACWLLTYPMVGWLGAAGLTGTAYALAGLAALTTAAACVLWPRSTVVSRPQDVDVPRDVTA